MTHFGEIISLIVAVSWTTTALFASEASHRLGSMSVNVIRLVGASLSLMAVRYTNAGIASTLMALTPVLILLPYSIIYKQKIELKEAVGASISMAGVAMFFLL